MIKIDHNTLKILSLGIVFIIAALLAFYVTPYFVFLLFIPLFLIPFLREFGVLKDTDERERFDGYRSSHWALYVIIIIVLTQTVEAWLNEYHLFFQQEYYLMIAIIIAVKVIGGLVSNFGFKKTGLILGIFTGAIWLLIAIPSLELKYKIIGLVLIAVTILAYYFPYIGSALLFIIGIVFAFYPANIFGLHLVFSGTIFLIIMFPLPPVLTGYLFIMEKWLNIKSAKEIEKSAVEAG